MKWTLIQMIWLFLRKAHIRMWKLVLIRITWAVTLIRWSRTPANQVLPWVKATYRSMMILLIWTSCPWHKRTWRRRLLFVFLLLWFQPASSVRIWERNRSRSHMYRVQKSRRVPLKRLPSHLAVLYRQKRLSSFQLQIFSLIPLLVLLHRHDCIVAVTYRLQSPLSSGLFHVDSPIHCDWTV